jgi:hypothetical protein
MRKNTDPLAHWLSLTWDRPERSYNPDVRDFLAGLLDYPRTGVVMEDRATGGFPDIKLKSREGIAWVVGDLKKEDAHLTDLALRQALWQDKRKYVDGLTRYALFLTARYLWVVLPDGSPIAGLEEPLDLNAVRLPELKARLAFLRYDRSSHEQQWQQFTEGVFPFSFLNLTEPETLKRLRSDLQAGFEELTAAAARALADLETQYEEYKLQREEIERNMVGHLDTQRRARVRLELRAEFVRRLFGEALPQFEEQYGREFEANGATERDRRLREAFIADSTAALIARVLFLRLVEDLKLARRRLTNGGPRDWAAFVEFLTGDARALVRLVADDMALAYREPLERTVFDWIQYANGALNEALQRLILRLNAYDFAYLSEEILGDIYQQFLPRAKRKRLGEYYTPSSIVDWILDRTVGQHGLGSLLDPACGSGSFLVRHAHRRLADAQARRLDPAETRRELENEVWGFDLNPFAAFISHFQLTWALLRSLPGARPPRVHVYNLNSLLNDTDIVPFIGEKNLPSGAKERDGSKWRYVVGNPPYIRAERVKYGGEMRELWREIWGQNSDTGLVFLYRALREWLEEGGFLGMVVSGGYANSEAAAKVWRRLHPGGTAALRKIVWLEFVGNIWDPNVIPMLLIIDRVPAQEDDEIELYVPSVWPGGEPPQKIRYGDFFDNKVSPRVSNGVSPWGDYLLPLLHPGDAPLLRRLYPDGNGGPFRPLGEVVEWTYGVQRGGVEVTEQPAGTRPIQVIPGRSLAVAWHGEPAGWVDLDAVEQRPYGKLSLWHAPPYPDRFIAVTNIGLAPMGAVISSPNRDTASLDTTIVSKIVQANADAVAAYLNSSLAHFYWALRLRTGVLEGSSRSHVYPRTLEMLPWPRDLTPEDEQRLADGYARLAALAARAKDNPNEWLLAEAERRIAAAHLRVTESALGLRFGDITEARADELVLNGARIEAGPFLFAELADSDLAEYVFRVLTLTGDEEAVARTQESQKLLVPRDYAAMMHEYRRRDAEFRRVEQDFMRALADADEAVFAAFGLSPDEQEYVARRLAAFPLNRLKPRYPWETVRPRPIKAYMADRFA